MPKRTRKPLGRVLWKLRHDHELTLSDVHKKTGIAASTLSRIEAGRSDPAKSTLEKLVAVYKVEGGLGALYSKAQVPAASSRRAGSQLGATNSPGGPFVIDAATFAELQELTARLHRLIGIIEGTTRRLR